MSGATELKDSLRGTAGEQPESRRLRVDEDGNTTGASVTGPPPPAPDPDEPIEAHDDGSYTVHITNPLAPYAGKGADPAFGLDKIKVNELYAGALMLMDRADGDQAKLFALVQSLTQVPSSILERLHWEDYARLRGIVEGKMGKFLGTSLSASRS